MEPQNEVGDTYIQSSSTDSRVGSIIMPYTVDYILSKSTFETIYIQTADLETSTPYLADSYTIYLTRCLRFKFLETYIRPQRRFSMLNQEARLTKLAKRII